jgi:hypothetical protein
VSSRVYEVTYRYCDASNYKFWGQFNVLGELRLDELEPYLFDRQFFIPERIGLPSLVPEARNDDDHLLHEFIEVQLVESKAGEAVPYVLTSAELVDRVRRANAQDWFTGMS